MKRIALLALVVVAACGMGEGVVIDAPAPQIEIGPGPDAGPTCFCQWGLWGDGGVEPAGGEDCGGYWHCCPSGSYRIGFC